MLRVNLRLVAVEVFENPLRSQEFIDANAAVSRSGLQVSGFGALSQLLHLSPTGSALGSGAAPTRWHLIPHGDRSSSQDVQSYLKRYETQLRSLAISATNVRIQLQHTSSGYEICLRTDSFGSHVGAHEIPTYC